MKRISDLVYKDIREALRSFLENVIRVSVLHTEHAQRKTVSGMDIVYGLKSENITLYGDVYDRSVTTLITKQKTRARRPESVQKYTWPRELPDGLWCLSIRQPWASLIMDGIKDVENRNWVNKHVAKNKLPLLVLVHSSGNAAEKKDIQSMKNEDSIRIASEYANNPIIRNTKSAILGVMVIDDIRNCDLSDSKWAIQNNYCWHILDVLKFKETVKNVTGTLGFWKPEEEEYTASSPEKVEGPPGWVIN